MNLLDPSRCSQGSKNTPIPWYLHYNRKRHSGNTKMKELDFNMEKDKFLKKNVVPVPYLYNPVFHMERFINS